MAQIIPFLARRVNRSSSAPVIGGGSVLQYPAPLGS